MFTYSFIINYYMLGKLDFNYYFNFMVDIIDFNDYFIARFICLYFMNFHIFSTNQEWVSYYKYFNYSGYFHNKVSLKI